MSVSKKPWCLASLDPQVFRLVSERKNQRKYALQQQAGLKGKNKGKSMANDKVEVEKEEISISEKVETKEEPKVEKDSEKPDEPMNMAIDEAADGAPEEKTRGEKNDIKSMDLAEQIGRAHV